MRLKNKIALITGAGSGIGRATAQCFAAEGAIVIAADINQAEALITQELIERVGGKCQALQVDVSQEAQVKDAIAKTVSIYGRLDLMHNNAGISIIKPMIEITEADLDRLIGINFKGVFFGCKHAIAQMSQQKKGIIINTASELALVGQPLYSAYCGTKGAVVAMTRALSAEWSAQGIRINALCPGPIDTPMLRAEFDLATDPKAEAQAAINSIPAGNLGTAEDIAKVALFLASDDAQFVHGAAIVADGGKTTI
ncbi:SDR family NAD(P)-dependent oxidoreductase [Pleurocapsa sp. PCC 7319]|uniref:SDR family NAD(P)-dependent oxidoreductase n=1 Tax=Pleurocapsa sp. PCC 7319 TaxID=118161 RepID=UPI0003464BEF|nr:glucose 1-dehydrogenase [Pleurocapsa sp. PCC 7319]